MKLNMATAVGAFLILAMGSQGMAKVSAESVQSVRTEIISEFEKLSADQEQLVDEKMNELLLLAQNMERMQKTGLLDWVPVTFTCIGGGVTGVLVGTVGYKCVTNRYDVFEITTFGVKLGLSANVNLVVGVVTGEISNGNHEIYVAASGHLKLGGTALIAGPLMFAGAGVGVGADIVGPTDSDSMFGGQLTISGLDEKGI